MFMVKDEFANVIKLTKVRLRSQSNSWGWFAVAMACILSASLSGMIFAIVRNNNFIHTYTVSDFSWSFFVGILIGCIVRLFTYRKTNAKQSVFPQTNSSRLISSLLVMYYISLITIISVLIMYLLHYGTAVLMSSFTDNIHLELNTGVGFIASGFLASLAYTFLAIAIIELIAAILRKWTPYAGIAFVALFSLAVVNFDRVSEYALNVLAFLIREPSLVLFFLKAAGLWLVVTALTLVINYFTVYNKSQNMAVNKRITIACVAIAILLMIVVPGFMMFSVTVDDGWVLEEYDESVHELPVAGADEIRIDISHLPDGSSIKLGGTHTVVEDGFANVSAAIDYTSFVRDIVVLDIDLLDNLHGDTLVLQFNPPRSIVDGIDLFEYANPHITAHLDGNTLILDYYIDYDRTIVLIMPIWSLARQFDAFKDGGFFVFVENPFWGTSHWGGHVELRVE